MRNHGAQAKSLQQQMGLDPRRKVVDFSASLNPMGMPPALESLGIRWTELASAYPSPDAEEACTALAQVHGLQNAQVICGNGSTELMALVLLAAEVRRTWVQEPCWSGYAEASAFASATCTAGDLENAEPGDAVFLASPNNPDGVLLDPDWVRGYCQRHPQTWILLDLAFDDFLHGPTESPWWNGTWPGNLVRIKSLTKFFGIPGLRLGFLALGNGDASENLGIALRKRMLPWSVNGLAQFCAPQLYLDTHWMEDSRDMALRQGNRIQAILAHHGFRTTRCPAWVLAWPTDGRDAASWQRRLLEQGICVRLLSTDGGCLRLGLLHEDACDLLEQALTTLRGNLVHVYPSRKVPSLLIAGTTSDAGKSMVATGFCGLWRTQGMRPMPYKAQNMSNHAWVTPEGGEIGWAQAVQAFAAGVVPHVDMNPVLLKPGAQGKSHVVHRGIDQGAMTVQEYHASFSGHRKIALAALDSLASRSGSLVLEGAGGLAEINLRHRDLSNREAPLHAQSKILLVGDIDRGGVFASLYGSYACLDKNLRDQVAGFAINRFRGDASLLDSGIEELQQRTGIPMLGVIPWRSDLHLGDEDSLGLGEQPLPPPDQLRIGVIRLPQLSNVNDWAPLALRPGVTVFHSIDPDKLCQADALILPGTRTTIADLKWLRSSGVASMLARWNCAHKPLLAICGGMQMLGESVADPYGVEDEACTMEIGLGILPMRTELRQQNKVVQARLGTVSPDVATACSWLRNLEEIRGYEIHCGQSAWAARIPEDWIPWLDGAIHRDGSLWSTYWHGILHHGDLAERWMQMLARRSGKTLPPANSEEQKPSMVPTFLRKGIAMAENLVAQHLDWEKLLC